jgi:hypothetical protein
MHEDVEMAIRKEMVELRRVVKGSKLGKHITDNILIPILKKLDKVLEDIIDWMAFLLHDEIQYLLSTAETGSRSFKIYYVDPDMPYGQRTTEIGEYEPSTKGGPPKSPKYLTGDLPQSGTLYRSIVYEIRGSTILLGIKELRTPYKLWVKKEWGKMFLFADQVGKQGRSTTDYGQILDDPLYAHHRPYFKSAIQSIKPQIKKRFREEFRKAVQEATLRPTVRRALEVHFICRSV